MNEEKQDVNRDVLVQSKDLMQAAIDLSVYRYTLSFSVGMLIVVVLLGGSISLLYSIIDSAEFFIVGWLLLAISAIMIHLYVFRHVLRRVEPMKNEIFIWGFTYPLVYFSGYAINGILKNLISPEILWYPLLGIANFIIGMTIEHYHFSKQELFNRPILTFSICLLVSTPILFTLLLFIPDQSVHNLIVTGIGMIIASLTTSYSIAQAEKKVVQT